MPAPKHSEDPPAADVSQQADLTCKKAEPSCEDSAFALYEMNVSGGSGFGLGLVACLDELADGHHQNGTCSSRCVVHPGMGGDIVMQELFRRLTEQT